MGILPCLGTRTVRAKGCNLAVGFFWTEACSVPVSHLPFLYRQHWSQPSLVLDKSYRMDGWKEGQGRLVFPEPREDKGGLTEKPRCPKHCP